MELNLVNDNNEALNSVNVPDSLFDRSYNESVVHQLVVSYLANARSVSSAQKDRSQVSKSTRKPWKQKGTGRARAGTAASPLWRGGGQIFPNNAKENYSHKVNRKMYRAGISIIYSQLIRDNRLLVVDSLVVNNPKTKTLVLKLENLSLKYVLIITEKIDENLYLSSRNLPRVKVVEPGSADPYNLLKYKKVLVTKAAIIKIQGLMT